MAGAWRSVWGPGGIALVLAILPAAMAAQDLSAADILAHLRSQRVHPSAAARLTSGAGAASLFAPGAAGGARTSPFGTTPATAVGGSAPPPPQPPAAAAATPLDLAIPFARGSALPEPAARPQLAALCAAIAADVPDGRYRIVGHTDAAGAAEDNLALSQARADAMVRHLSGECGIAPARLEAAGMGEAAPKHADTPQDAANRRVEIVVTR